MSLLRLLLRRPRAWRHPQAHRRPIRLDPGRLLGRIIMEGDGVHGRRGLLQGHRLSLVPFHGEVGENGGGVHFLQFPQHVQDAHTAVDCLLHLVGKIFQGLDELRSHVVDLPRGPLHVQSLLKGFEQVLDIVHAAHLREHREHVLGHVDEVLVPTLLQVVEQSIVVLAVVFDVHDDSLHPGAHVGGEVLELLGGIIRVLVPLHQLRALVHLFPSIPHFFEGLVQRNHHGLQVQDAA
mmetsp:Transcript_104839/g.338081  ORF Transcript_104839/g.338081 Transcript_104839/m.338081 type:complete len:236 (-) Transcript_104839:376-1083(-)